MRRLWGQGIVVALVGAIALAASASASAAGATFSISPTTRAPYFIFNSKPGSVIQGQVRVVNVSSTPGQASLYAVDATTGQTSGAVYQSRGAPRHAVGAWIKLAATSLSLGPHQSARVAFTVNVPAGAGSGQHLGGLVAAPVKPTTTHTSKRGKHTFHVNIEEIAVVAVQVNLPGALVHKLSISGVKASGRPGYQTVLIGLTNSGNAFVKGTGKLGVTQGSRQLLTSTFPLDTMVPGTSIDYPVYVRGPRLAPGNYSAQVKITYTGGGTAGGTFPFTVSNKQLRQTFGSTVPPSVRSTLSKGSSSVPIWAIILGALALIAISIGGSALFFRRRTKGD